MLRLLVVLTFAVGCRSAPGDLAPGPTAPPEELASAGQVSLGSRGTIAIGMKPPLPPDYVTNDYLCLSHDPNPCKPEVTWHYHDDGIRRQSRPQVRVRITRDSIIQAITTQFDGFVTFDSVVADYVRALGAPDTIVVHAESRSAFWAREHWVLRVWKDWRYAAVTTWFGNVAPLRDTRRQYQRSLRSDLEWFWSRCMEASPEHCAF